MRGFFYLNARRLILPFLILFIVLPVSAQSRTLTFVSNVSDQLGGGRDLGITCGPYMFFGDTFDGVSTDNGPAGNWLAPNSGAVIVGHRGDGTPVLNALNGPFAPLFQPTVGAITVTPTGCIVAHGAVYLWYMEIQSNAGHDFQAIGGGIAASFDGGLTWAKHPIVPGDNPGTQAALVAAGGYAYALGTESGRTGYAVVGRAPLSRILERDSWRWWDGEGWNATTGGSGIPVIPGPVGEIGLCDNGLWQAAYMSPEYGGIVLRRAARLTGPWSDAEVILPWGEPGGEAWGTYAPQPFGVCGVDWLISSFPRYSVERWRLE